MGDTATGSGRNGGRATAVGLTGLVLGAVGLVMVLAAPAVGMSCYGVLLAILGGLQFGGLTRGHGRAVRAVRIALALAYLGCGLALVFEPTSVGAVQGPVAMLFGAGGLLQIVGASALPRRSRPWGIVVGAGSVLLGVLVLAGPASADWLLGAAAALGLAFYGGAALLQARVRLGPPAGPAAPSGGLSGL